MRRLPAHGRLEQGGVDDEQYKPGLPAKEGIRDHQDLLGRRAVDEPVIVKLRRKELAARLRRLPGGMRRDVANYGALSLRISLRQAQILRYCRS
jgi:hypothetical protein